MSELSLTGQDMLAWNESTSDGWRQLISENPEVLEISCDVMNVKTVGELLQHIVAVELRYAERLVGLPATDYATIPFDSVGAIYATHDRAIALLGQQLVADPDWDEQIEFMTRTWGPARASRKTIFFHALLHSARHYAQLATLVRQHGIRPGWAMDYLMMGVERV
jgi:uncharacterized damage-inducible protein DinB